jgi:hypothetical protein
MSHSLFDWMRKLEDQNAPFTIHRYRDDSVMLIVTLPGERIEIDIFEDGHIEYSRFSGTEEVLDDLAALEELIKEE